MFKVPIEGILFSNVKVTVTLAIALVFDGFAEIVILPSARVFAKNPIPLSATVSFLAALTYE